MAKLVIDDLEDDVVARLKERAAAQSMSPEQAAREILRRGLPTRAEAAAAFARLRAMTPPGLQSDSTDIVRAMRDGA